jgi:hypothetical protein
MTRKQRIKNLEFDVKFLREAVDTLYNVVEVLAIKSGVDFCYDLEGLLVGGLNCSEDLKSKDIRKELEPIEQSDNRQLYIYKGFPKPNTALNGTVKSNLIGGCSTITGNVTTCGIMEESLRVDISDSYPKTTSDSQSKEGAKDDNK